MFLRVSGFLQLTFLFSVLAFFFVTPPFTDSHPHRYIPSFWFVGLLHMLRGNADARMEQLALQAILALAIVVPLAAGIYVFSWRRNMRRTVESPEILPARHSRWMNRVQFSDTPAADIFALDLRQDGAWLSDEAWVDTISARSV